MRECQHILVADYVPIDNKGEEAIIRGIEDMLRDHRPIEIGLFDKVDEVTHQGNITIFPREWIFRVEGTSVWSWSIRFKNVMFSLLRRLGYYSKLKNLVFSLNPKYRPLQDFFRRAEYILVGHDGVFTSESCGIIHVAKKAGKCTGVLGMGSSIGLKAEPFKNWLFGYARAVDESDFWVFREHYSQERMQRICRDPAKLRLAPDPAFAMRPAESAAARTVLESCARYQSACQSKKRIVAATVREKGRTYTNVFLNVGQPDSGQEKHAEFVARILDCLIKERDSFVLFLPHSVEKDGNDVEAAHHVVAKMTSEPENYMILDENLDPRLLKSIIRECDFLVGERLHSVIGSVSVATPFLCLTDKDDFRTHGIIGEMCGCEDQIVDMVILDYEEICRKAVAIFDDRKAIEKILQEVSRTQVERLAEVSSMIMAVGGHGQDQSQKTESSDCNLCVP